MRKRIPRCHFFGTELSRLVRSHSQARLKARLGMGPNSPGQLCTEEGQHGILLVAVIAGRRWHTHVQLPLWNESSTRDTGDKGTSGADTLWPTRPLQGWQDCSGWCCHRVSHLVFTPPQGLTLEVGINVLGSSLNLMIRVHSHHNFVYMYHCNIVIPRLIGWFVFCIWARYSICFILNVKRHLALLLIPHMKNVLLFYFVDIVGQFIGWPFNILMQYIMQSN